MSNYIDLREVTVRAPFLDALGVGVSSCVIDCQCNIPTKAKLSVNFKGPAAIVEGISNVTVQEAEKGFDELLKIAARAQKNVFTALAGTRGSVTINNINKQMGIPESLTFEGFLAAPAFQIRAGVFEASFTITHPDVALEAYHPNVYTRLLSINSAGGSGQSGGNAYNEFKKFLTSDSSQRKSITGQILKIVDILDKLGDNPGFSNLAAGVMDEKSKENHETLHAQNKRVLGTVKTFLESSNPFFWADTDLSGNLSTAPYDVENYARWMLNNFVSSNNFFNYIISVICPNFELEYVSDFSGSRLEHVKYNESTSTSASIESGLSGFGLNLANEYQRPLKQVAVRGNSTDIYGAGGASTSPIACWPNEASQLIEDGKIVTVAAPSWLVKNKLKIESAGTASKNKPKPPAGKMSSDDDATRDITSNSEQQTKEVQENEKIPDTYLNMLEKWAERKYGILALANTRSNLDMPLNLQWANSKKLGNRYQVEVASLPLFSGYLDSVRHTVVLDANGNTGSATTNAQFAYIKGYDNGAFFDLPGGSYAPASSVT